MKIIKTKILAVLLVMCVGMLDLQAQIVQSFEYTGYAKDCECNPMENGATINTITVWLLEGSARGTGKYQETHSNKSVGINGSYTVIVGQGTPVAGQFSDCDFIVQDYYIKIKINDDQEVVQKLYYDEDETDVDKMVKVDNNPAPVPENAGVVIYGGEGAYMQFYNGKIWNEICCMDQCFGENCKGVIKVETITTGGVDIDYKTITIGGQIWMLKNSNVSITGRKCYDNLETNCDLYGGLYTETMVRDNAAQMCPEGFGIPTYEEFEVLKTELGKFPGKKIQAIGNSCSDGLDDGLDECAYKGYTCFNNDLNGIYNGCHGKSYNLGEITFYFMEEVTINFKTYDHMRITSSEAGFSYSKVTCNSSALSVRCIKKQ